MFSEHNSELQITLFSIWHILYLMIVAGLSIGFTLGFKNKSDRAKNIVTSVFAYLTIGLYIADFFIMPLSDSYNGISLDKLPFHICTIMAVLAPFVQFNPKFKAIKTPVIMLSITSSLMWMTYPGSALNGQPPFCYVVFQTFMYHGFLFTWGVLSVTLGGTKFYIKECWKEFVGILLIFIWACFGNGLYETQNWFFIKESIFSFLPDEIMPLVVIVSVFAVCLCVYGMYYIFKVIFSKKKKDNPETPTEKHNKNN